MHDLEQLLANFNPSSSFPEQHRLYSKTRKLLKKGDAPAHFTPIRIAMIGSGTFQAVAQLLRLHLLAAGIAPTIFEGEYNNFRQEALNPNSALFTFQPDIVIIITDHRDLMTLSALKPGVDITALAQEELSTWAMIWQSIATHAQCPIIQNNFDTPELRDFDQLETRVAHSQGHYIRRLTLMLAEQLPANVILHDLDYLTSYHGKRNWYDPRYYFHAKQACALNYAATYAASLTRLIKVQTGKVRKCLVLDLDNTLWGGVIGDDGLSGIELGQGSPVGEAHLALQHYASTLKKRGVLLAVCSKNDVENAKLPFTDHPDMHLGLADIACFVANWHPKPDNLQKIATELNIGLDSLVFVDDNPAEREIVRQFLPQVAVPEMPQDPAYYVRILNELAYFEPLTFSAEDGQRTEMYKANQARKAAQLSTQDMGDFLKSLKMEAIIRPFQDADIERVAQLIARSNQFNLTTRRHDKETLERFRAADDYLTLSVRLKDRFGDNGLIAVWIGKVDTHNSTLEIDTWLMSCRVLSRGVEQHLMNIVVDACKQHNIQTVHGVYIPTKKNGMVASLYEKLGFTTVETTDNIQRSTLDVANYTAFETAIHNC